MKTGGDDSVKREFIFYTAGDYQDTPSTGGTRRYRELLEHFLEAGDRIYLLAPENIQIPAHENLNHVRLKPYQSNLLPNGLLNYLMNRKSFRLMRQFPSDGVLIFSVPYALQCIMAGLKNIQLFIREDIVRNADFHSRRKKGLSSLSLFKLLVYKFLERYALKKAQKIIVQSNYAKDLLKRRHPAINNLLDEKLYVLYNNVNAGWILRYSGYIRQKPVTPGRTYHFLFVGTINTELKGLHLLLKAVKTLLYEEYPVQLDVIGDGKLKSDYKHIYNKEKGIQFLGRVKEPMKVMPDYDLLIVPSLADSFPNVILEALYLEMPVIGSRAGGIPEILDYPELMFEPNEKSITRKLREVIELACFEEYRQKCKKRKQSLTFHWGEKVREIVIQ
jgi:glycosyltransferase involved in cell wall biosynthesis